MMLRVGWHLSCPAGVPARGFSTSWWSEPLLVGEPPGSSGIQRRASQEMLAEVVWRFLTQCYLPHNLLGGTDTINPDTRGGGQTHPLSGWRIQEPLESLKSWQVEGRSPRKEPQEA